MDQYALGQKGLQLSYWFCMMDVVSVESLLQSPAYAIAGKTHTRSINSCLAPLGTLDGAQIITVEGIGNSKKGFHPVQGVAQCTL